MLHGESQRAYWVRQLIHSGEMEGFTVDDETLADAQEYVAGRITSDILVERVKARYS